MPLPGARQHGRHQALVARVQGRRHDRRVLTRTDHQVALARAKGVRHAEAVRAVQGDNFVQELVNLFDGRVVDSTIREKPQ